MMMLISIEAVLVGRYLCSHILFTLFSVGDLATVDNKSVFLHRNDWLQFVGRIETGRPFLK